MDAGAYLAPINPSRLWQLDELRVANPQTTVAHDTKLNSGDNERGRAEAARQLASLFIYQLLRELRKSVPKSGLWEGGRAQEIYDQMIDERLADVVAGTRQFGLADMIEEDLARFG